MDQLVDQNGDTLSKLREQYEQNELNFHYPTYHHKHCFMGMF